jgi:hypothetical protein
MPSLACGFSTTIVASCGIGCTGARREASAFYLPSNYGWALAVFSPPRLSESGADFWQPIQSALRLDSRLDKIAITLINPGLPTLDKRNSPVIKQLTVEHNCTKNSGDVMKLWIWLFVGLGVTGISFRLIVVTHANPIPVAIFAAANVGATLGTFWVMYVGAALSRH